MFYQQKARPTPNLTITNSIKSLDSDAMQKKPKRYSNAQKMVNFLAINRAKPFQTNLHKSYVAAYSNIGMNSNPVRSLKRSKRRRLLPHLKKNPSKKKLLRQATNFTKKKPTQITIDLNVS